MQHYLLLLRMLFTAAKGSAPAASSLPFDSDLSALIFADATPAIVIVRY